MVGAESLGGFFFDQLHIGDDVIAAPFLGKFGFAGFACAELVPAACVVAVQDMNLALLGYSHRAAEAERAGYFIERECAR